MEGAAREGYASTRKMSACWQLSVVPIGVDARRLGPSSARAWQVTQSSFSITPSAVRREGDEAIIVVAVSGTVPHSAQYTCRFAVRASASSAEEPLPLGSPQVMARICSAVVPQAAQLIASMALNLSLPPPMLQARLRGVGSESTAGQNKR
jgi:hypothetical protein